MLSKVHSKIAWRIVPFLLFCYLVAFLDRVNISFAKLTMLHSLGLSDAAYGLGAGIFFISYFLFEIPSNVFLVKFGARIWLARIMVTWGLITLLFIFLGDIYWFGLAQWFEISDSALSFYVLRFILGFAEAGFFPGIIFYLTLWFPKQNCGKYLALFLVAIPVSNVIGGPVSGSILQYMNNVSGLQGWQWLFVLEGIPTIFLGILILFILPDGPNSAKWLTVEEKAFVSEQLSVEDHHHGSFKELIRVILTDSDVLRYAAIAFFIMANIYALNFWMPTIIQQFGYGQTNYFILGLFTMIPWGCSALVMVWWGHHSDAHDERRWHIAVGLVVAALGYVMLIFVRQLPIFAMIAISIITIGIMASEGIFWVVPSRVFSSTKAAIAIALINSIANLGGYASPTVIGYVRTHYKNFDNIIACIFIASLLVAAVLQSIKKCRASSS